MRKLHLASFKYKDGNTDILEETRLIASFGANYNMILADAETFWKREAEGTEREFYTVVILPTLTEDEPKSQIGQEETIIQAIRKMCEQSLDPDTFAKWEDVEKTLRLTRKAQVNDKPTDIRQRPAAHTLQEIFKELKFGRPAKSQDHLDRFIRELDRYENDALDEKEVIAGALDEYAQMFPELKDAIRQAKIALIGEGLAFEFLPVEFNIAKGEKGDDATPMIGDGVHDGFYGEGKTNGDRAIDFLTKLLNDDQYLIVKRRETTERNV